MTGIDHDHIIANYLPFDRKLCFFAFDLIGLRFRNDILQLRFLLLFCRVEQIVARDIFQIMMEIQIDRSQQFLLFYSFKHIHGSLKGFISVLGIVDGLWLDLEFERYGPGYFTWRKHFLWFD